ncbi:tetratricopeptide repeat protein 21B [Chanos chanos]|uniref:Tetratricopeptide repeat protein 21B n=1 Tax=Chanos chanos TaxID=29144 RepID=A0A6J2UUT4_CHACN|nr:tetratricopeptide repeat protein 21A [Chanos chanos]
MAESDPKCLVSIIYYFREKFYRHAINTTVSYLRIHTNDPVLLFFKAIGILMEGRIQEAIQELQQIKDRSPVSLCSIMALIHAHRQSDTIDQNTMAELESCAKVSRKTALKQTLYYNGLFLWLLGCNEKAKDYITRMLKLSKCSGQGLILLGWILLSSEDEAQKAQAIDYLETGIGDSLNVFGLIGKIEFFMVNQKKSFAMYCVNQIIASHPDFIPAFEIKMNICLSLCDWEQTMEMAERILEKDRHNLKALQMMTILAVAKDGNPRRAKEYLEALLNAVKVSEPNAPVLHVNITKPISRLCGRDQDILQILTSFVQLTHSQAPRDIDIASELGYLMVLQRKYRDASKWYSVALRADTSCVSAFEGTIRCHLMNGEIEEAEQQLEFLCEIQKSTGPSVEVTLLQAILACRKGAAQKTVVSLLVDATNLHLKGVKELSYAVESLQKFNVNLLLELVNMFLYYCQDQPLIPGQPFCSELINANRIVRVLVQATPGMLMSCYLMARVKFLMGAPAAAQDLLDLCMEKDPTVPDVILLQAKMHLHAGENSKCLDCLEYGVSHNLAWIREPRYILVKAKAQLKSGELSEAIKSLKMVMNMPGVRNPTKGQESSISNSERATAFLDLAEALTLNGEQHEATKVIQDAILSFKDTPEEVRVLLANVDLSLAKGDINAALMVLQHVTPNWPNYLQAKEKMAHIYLEKRGNKSLYIACYREIHKQIPGPHSCMLLGDAFMKIQEYEKAIETYKEGMNCAPKDPTFPQKIGHAHLKTHQYHQAVGCYLTALQDNKPDSLCVKLVELLIKMQHFERAGRILHTALNHRDSTDLNTMMNDVKYLRLLVKVLQATDQPFKGVMEEVYTLQTKILNHLPLEQPHIATQQNMVASDICCELGQLDHLENNLEMAKQWYSKALTHSPDNNEIILKIAHLFYDQHKLDHCEDQCLKILQTNEKHTAASMLLADVWFRKNQPNEAIRMYSDLMKQFPDNFHSLLKFLNLLRRVGRIDDILPYFEACELRSPRATTEPGYNFCKGLYLWHVYRVNEALVYLNKARRDTEWGNKALELMIQICLNPDKDTVGGDLFEDSEKETTSNDYNDQMGMSTALCLLKEFRTHSSADKDKATLLYCLCLIHSREPMQVEGTLPILTQMVSSRTEKCTPLLAMAQALMVLKHRPKARNQLKRLTKKEWTEDTAEPLEEAWLLLADIFIKSGKYDIASKHLDHCIHHNKSCSKAYEYKGFMMENECSYKDAAEQYELAWTYSSRINPTIGYRLAFNYLKSKNYTKAIDICHQVLREHPDYPQIRSDILTHAQQSLRP